MDLIPFFSTAILVATVASIVLAVISYAAYKSRERRRPNRRFDPSENGEIMFFHVYDPPAAGALERTGTDGQPGNA